MANGRGKGRKGDSGRDGGGFAAIPWSVLDAPAYARLSHPAKALLMEVARQFVRDNNGRLLCSMAYLGPRGWRSNDVITRAARELVAAGFIYQTVQGHRPNKASWYAITWQSLDRHPGYDAGAIEGFQRSAYRSSQQSTVLPKISPLKPPAGAKVSPIAPANGVEKASPTPCGGAIGAGLAIPSTPPDGDHLEMPSVAAFNAGDSTSTVKRNSAP